MPLCIVDFPARQVFSPTLGLASETAVQQERVQLQDKVGLLCCLTPSNASVQWLNLMVWVSSEALDIGKKECLTPSRWNLLFFSIKK